MQFRVSLYIDGVKFLSANTYTLGEAEKNVQRLREFNDAEVVRIVEA